MNLEFFQNVFVVILFQSLTKGVIDAQQLVSLGSWKAVNMTAAQLKQATIQYTAGFKQDPRPLMSKTFRVVPKQSKVIQLPTNFDARMKWPQCAELIGTIRNQERCGACWAFATANMVADRLCIAGQGSFRQQISTEDLITCMPWWLTRGQTNLCTGFDPKSALQMIISEGVVTGGDRQQPSDGCLPYSNQLASAGFGDTRTCRKACSNNRYTIKYSDDKRTALAGVVLGHSWFWVGPNGMNYTYTLDAQGKLAVQNGDTGSVEYLIMAEIFQNGPVLAGAFDLYEDFLGYRSGVYRSNYWRKVAQHAIKIIGWGVENGWKYWLCVNSWGAQWGDRGMFKIARGENHCGIEQYLLAVTIPTTTPVAASKVNDNTDSIIASTDVFPEWSYLSRSGGSVSAGGAKLAWPTKGSRDLTLYSPDGSVLWSLASQLSGADEVKIESGGNMVFYNNSTTILASSTYGRPGSFLRFSALKPQGASICVRDKDDTGCLWKMEFQKGDRSTSCESSTGNAGPFVDSSDTLFPGQEMLASQRLVSNNQGYSFWMLESGNAVLYRRQNNGTMQWWFHTATMGNLGAKIILQKDGNLVVLDKDGKSLWKSFTQNYCSQGLKLFDNGTLCLQFRFRCVFSATAL